MTDLSLSEQAYGQLRRMIVRLDFAPGDVLREDALQDTLGMSRTPIREALQRLAREHFVTVIPRRGMFVSGIDVSELGLLFETRSVLEPYAARLAAAAAQSVSRTPGNVGAVPHGVLQTLAWIGAVPFSATTALPDVSFPCVRTRVGA